MLSPDIQQGLSGTGRVWPPDWWSAWPFIMGQLFLGHGQVSDTCSAFLAAAARPCQPCRVPASYDHTGRGLPAVVVR